MIEDTLSSQAQERVSNCLKSGTFTERESKLVRKTKHEKKQEKERQREREGVRGNEEGVKRNERMRRR